MTNVPAPAFGPTGFIAPTEEAILEGVSADLDAAFGGGLNPALETPQGQLATSLAAIIGETDDTFVYYTQQVDPAYATGRMQDAIARIYFLERNPALPTVVQGVCSGAEGTVIPAGSLAQAADGNLYTCTDGGVIAASGTVTLSFSCNVVGPIPCPAGTLNQIYQVIGGWDSITNPDDGVLGQDTESRSAFEDRRAASVALNSRGSLPSILGAVLDVPDVLDAYVTENDTDVALPIGDYTLIPNSLYVAVVGGDQDAVAEAIWSRKAPGCSYNGNTTVVVEDTNSGYSPPYPSYDVKFEVPAALPILFAVVIVNNPQVPADAATQIQNAIIAAFAGEDGGTRARIGSTLYASRYYAPVAALGSWVQIVSIDIGSTNTPTATFTGSISGTTMHVTSVASGTLAVGQTVSGTGVTEGTHITALAGGTGGIGDYTLDIMQSMSSSVMKTALPTSNTVVVGIDQVPTIAAVNIAVTAP